MPQLDIYTNSDAEVFVMDAALNRVTRSVGSFGGNLDAGLYKIRVSRAGTLQEQLIELTAEPQQHYMFVDRFSAIAPIGPMLSDSGRIESLARAALKGRGKATILVLAHQSAVMADRDKPFGGASIFPWRGTRHAVKLDKGQRSAKAGDEVWSAIALRADPADGPFVLELRNDARVSRQAVLVAEGWQTRIFLQARDARAMNVQPSDQGTGTEAPFDVSIQMARPGTNVVYSDHWETVEVARSALERGRAIFTSDRLVNELLDQKYDNPIAGLTGLHLFLDAKVRSDAGDATYDLAPSVTKLRGGAQEIADTVLVNLTKLLYPDRVAAMQARAGSHSALQQALLFPDPDWPESPDLTALRLRAGRCRQQVFVPSPPMFRVSWDVLKVNAARDGLTWIGRELWSGTGAAGSAGPYLAWAPGRHSVRRTLERIKHQFAHLSTFAASLPRPSRVVEADMANGVTVDLAGATNEFALPEAEPAAIRPSMRSLQSVIEATADSTDQHRLAADFGIPLSILQEPPGKSG
ncbi:hypothetical protein ACCS66_35495 [Rhizobium ruizarguesonis]